MRRQPCANEIAAAIGAPRSSVYELVNLLLEHGMLEYQGGDGRVFLGRRLYFLGTAYAEQFDLMRECDRMLVRLAEETRETAQMCLLEGNKYHGRHDARGPAAVPHLVQRGAGSHPWTASGRLLLGHLSDPQISALIPPEFVMPDGGRLAAADFIAEVRRAASDGYFAFNSVVENFTHCFAAPVRQPTAPASPRSAGDAARGRPEQPRRLSRQPAAGRPQISENWASIPRRRAARLNSAATGRRNPPRPHRSPLATRHSSRMAHCWRGAAALGWH